jgi:hypothetical protein
MVISISMFPNSAAMFQGLIPETHSASLVDQVEQSDNGKALCCFGFMAWSRVPSK